MSPDAGPTGAGLSSLTSRQQATRQSVQGPGGPLERAPRGPPCVSREARRRSTLLQRLRVQRFHHPSTADTVPDCGAMPADGKSRRRLWPQAAAGGHERQQASHRSTTTLPPAASGISAARDPSPGKRTSFSASSLADLRPQQPSPSRRQPPLADCRVARLPGRWSALVPRGTLPDSGSRAPPVRGPGLRPSMDPLLRRATGPDLRERSRRTSSEAPGCAMQATRGTPCQRA